MEDKAHQEDELSAIRYGLYASKEDVRSLLDQTQGWIGVLTDEDAREDEIDAKPQYQGQGQSRLVLGGGGPVVARSGFRS